MRPHLFIISSNPIHLMNHLVHYVNPAVFSFFFSFIYLGFYVTFNTVQVISRRVVGRAEETSTYSSLGFCTVNCQPTASNYQLSHLRPSWGLNPSLRGGSVTTLPPWPLAVLKCMYHTCIVSRVVLSGLVVGKFGIYHRFESHK